MEPNLHTLGHVILFGICFSTAFLIKIGTSTKDENLTDLIGLTFTYVLVVGLPMFVILEAIYWSAIYFQSQ